MDQQKPWEIARQENAPPWMIAEQEDQAPQQFGLPTRARAFGQGVTYAWGDEIEAGLRAMVGPKTYEENRDEIRAELEAYRKAHPGEALTMEVAGALVPGILTRKMYLNNAGNPTLGRAAAGGAVEGGIYGAGAFTGDNAVDMGLAMGGGSLIGIPGGAAGHYAGKLIDWGGSKFGNFLREKVGSGYGDAVQAELTRLVEGTGKTVDEVVDAISNGSIIAENRTLQAVIRAFKSLGGKAGAEVTEAVPARRAVTRKAAQEAMQEGLTPGVTDNVFAAMRQTDDELGKAAGDAYKAIFKAVPEVDEDVAVALQNTLRQQPQAARAVQEVYDNSPNLVPFIKIGDNGEISLARMPSLEDAEMVRRTLAGLADDAYKGSKGTLGEQFKATENNLRTMLDTRYDDLATTRAAWATRKQMQEQFKAGQKAVGQNADQVAVDFEQVQKLGPEAVQAYRAGVMDRLRHKGRQSPTLFTRLADPDRVEGAVLQEVFPEGQYQGILGKLQSAGSMDDLYQKVMHNSMTAPEQAAASQIGSKLNAVDLMRVSQGDPLAVVDVAAKLTKGVGGLTDDQRLQVVKVLFSEDPDFVRAALLDNTRTGALIERVAQLSNQLQGGASTAINQQAAEQGLGILQMLEDSQ